MLSDRVKDSFKRTELICFLNLEVLNSVTVKVMKDNKTYSKYR